MILSTMYGPGPDGLCGNDDVGQMSAWYIFSAMGFYPVLPGSDQYALGSPLVNKAEINLPNSKILTIIAENQDPKNVYVIKVMFNGVEIKDFTLTHDQLIGGGQLKFYMDEQEGSY
jgi:putative alpha-1,2-mannosidase